jgi:uncharacterized protein (UPF0332 family)
VDILPARYFERLSGKAVAAIRKLVAAYAPLDPDGLDRVIREAVRQRMELAQGFLASAAAMQEGEEISSRNVVSRSYYAMYHAGRAVLLWVMRADVDGHQDVAKKVAHVEEFSEREHWKERLEFWRIQRNKVDYEPWAEREDELSQLREAIVREAQCFLRVCEEYLLKGGESND